jgi:feruloyl esterase
MTSKSNNLWRRSKWRLPVRPLAALALTVAFGLAIYTNHMAALAAPSGSTGSKTYDPVRSCTSLTSTAISENTDNVAYTVQEAIADSGTGTQPASCQVRVTTTHAPAGDNVTIWIWLPAADWNGRFMGTGGSGFSGGSVTNLAAPLSQGYVAGATDTGHPGNGGYILSPDGGLNWQGLRNDSLGVHEMTVAGKKLAEVFYGTKPFYAYFNGCSTGGRQGVNEARQYPKDYDGVLAASSAINTTKHRVSGIWGQLAMKEANNYIPQCKFDAANAAAIQACDMLDKVADGVITDPRDCSYDPQALVDTSTPCGTITQADADIIRKMWQGARDTEGNSMWYGLDRGASFSGLHNTTLTNGVLDGAPSAFMIQWIRYALLQNPSWDWHTLTPGQFEQLFTQSVEQYGTVISDTPNLEEFRKNGGKLLMWNGWTDQLVTPKGVIEFYDNVEAKVGSDKKMRDFARLFLAPGVSHCGGGNGPQPTGQLQALINWVEKGKAPDSLVAEKRDAANVVTQTRPLCVYPKVAQYKGYGSTDDAKSFRCTYKN